jgi:hypothetical protein
VLLGDFSPSCHQGKLPTLGLNSVLGDVVGT